MKNNFLIVIAGPTASGKTNLGIEMAKSFGTEIISADSRQIYKEMSIGTAAPGDDQLKQVKHHYIKTISIFDTYNAYRYEVDVLSLLDKLFAKHNIVFMVGGSGLYIDAVCEGIDYFPDTDPALRMKLEEEYRNEGIEGLRRQLKILDPVSYSKTDLKNPKRIQKALEISLMTGKPYSSFLSGTPTERPFGIIRTALDPRREELYRNINNRVLVMMENGLEEEARKLYPHKHINALNTVGYRELFECFDGSVNREEAIEKIQANTRKYARKQMTWFRKNDKYKWFHPDELKEIEMYIKSSVNSL